MLGVSAASPNGFSAGTLKLCHRDTTWSCDWPTRITGHYPGTTEVVTALDGLLGVGAGSIEWGYLNSGVHDSQRDHEFDCATVRTFAESVTALEEAFEALSGR